jgi:DNA-binding XRE family transcriptional regulator
LPRPKGYRNTPAENRRVKYAWLMREAGTPLHITDDELVKLRAHLAGLHGAGMSYALIAASAPGGHRETTVAKIINRWTSATHRDVYNDLMRAHYEQPTGYRTGARIDPTGMRRRVQGLFAIGFGFRLLGEFEGVSEQAVFQWATKATPIASSTAIKVAGLYSKLECADPFDYGATKQGVSRARNAARKRGWAPTTCWDPDTIDDPNAIPEWTGACGTTEGHRIHRREGIPICPPCHAASRADTVAFTPSKSGFSGAKLRKIREGRNMSRRELCELVGMDESSVIYWENGRSEPRRRNLDRVLSALGATFEDVCEEEI